MLLEESNLASLAPCRSPAHTGVTSMPGLPPFRLDLHCGEVSQGAPQKPPPRNSHAVVGKGRLADQFEVQPHEQDLEAGPHLIKLIAHDSPVERDKTLVRCSFKKAILLQEGGSR